MSAQTFDGKPLRLCEDGQCPYRGTHYVNCFQCYGWGLGAAAPYTANCAATLREENSDVLELSEKCECCGSDIWGAPGEVVTAAAKARGAPGR